jgi:WD40 repeat protein
MPGVSESSNADLHANDLLPLVWHTELEDYVVDLQWSADGELLAAMPAEGCPVLFDPRGGVLSLLEPHPGGNGALAWHPSKPLLASIGHDRRLRVYHPPFEDAAWETALPGSSWSERCGWNADGSLLAAIVGGNLIILDPRNGEILNRIPVGGTLADLCWNPARADELATAGPRGLHFWRAGEGAPTGHFPQSTAQLLSWSRDGRRIAIGHLGPDAHLLDRLTGKPLHIQGYQSKVKAFAWDSDNRWLATAGGENIVVWPCAGPEGPSGAAPVQLTGHFDKVESLDFAASQPVLFSGGRDGLLLIWMPDRSTNAGIILRRREAITRVRFCPEAAELAYATASGEVGVCAVAQSG